MNFNSEDRIIVNFMGILMIKWYDFYFDGGVGLVLGIVETEGLKVGIFRIFS